MKISDVIVIGGANVTFDPAVAPQLVNDSEVVAAFIRNAGALLGNVTLHPDVAPQLVNDSEVVAASIRNAGALLASKNFIGGELA